MYGMPSSFKFPFSKSSQTVAHPILAQTFPFSPTSFLPEHIRRHRTTRTSSKHSQEALNAWYWRQSSKVNILGLK